LFFLALATVSAQFDADIDFSDASKLTPFPIAEIHFNESVTVIRADFIKLDDYGIILEYYVNASITEYSAQYYDAIPTRGLNNGFYYFEIEAADMVGNIKVFREQFNLVFPALDIRVVNPSLGVTNKSEFDLKIATYHMDELYPDSQCKYGTQDPNDNFDASGLFPFSQSEGAIHTIFDFATMATLVPNVDSPAYFAVCIDDGERPTTERIHVLIDTLKPSISSLTFNPPKIIEFPLGGDDFQTTMRVVATEPVLCRYYMNESKPFNEMTKIGYYNAQDFDSFSEETVGVIKVL